MRSLYMVHIPKTGGRYIVVRALKHELAEGKHLPPGGLYRGQEGGRFHCGGHNVCHSAPASPIQYFDACCVDDAEFRHSLTFAVVRNPFDLLVSMFTARWPYQPQIHPLEFTEFDDFVRAYCDPEFAWAAPLQKQNLFFQLADDDGRCAVQELIRFESIDDELLALCATVGITPVRSEPFRPSRHGTDRDYRRWYTDALRELVERKCADELEQFGYGFDGVTGDIDAGAIRIPLDLGSP